MGRILSVFGKDIDSKYLINLCYALLKMFNQALIINYHVSCLSPPQVGILLMHALVSMRLRKLAGRHASLVETNYEDAVVITLSTVMGSIIIIAVLEPYFGQYIDVVRWKNIVDFYLVIAVFFIAIGYSYFAAFYRASAREIKRLGWRLHLCFRSGNH